MTQHPAVNMWLTGDLHNVLRGLAAGAVGFPDGEYARGYQAALVAVGLAVGMESSQTSKTTDCEPVRRGPSGTAFEGIENVPWAIGAFARMGR